MTEEHIELETGFFDTLPTEMFGAFAVKIGPVKYRVFGVIVPDCYVTGFQLRHDGLMHSQMIHHVKQLSQAVTLIHNKFQKEGSHEDSTEETGTED